jgi:hypothetical protein
LQHSARFPISILSRRHDLGFRPHSPPPLSHAHNPLPVLFKAPPQTHFHLFPTLPVLEPVEIVLDAVLLLSLLQLRLLLLCFFDASGTGTPASRDCDEALFVGDGARNLAVLVELSEVGVDAGLEGGGCWVGEGVVLAVS